jgi:hypothetical protein
MRLISAHKDYAQTDDLIRKEGAILANASNAELTQGAGNVVPQSVVMHFRLDPANEE